MLPAKSHLHTRPDVEEDCSIGRKVKGIVMIEPVMCVETPMLRAVSASTLQASSKLWTGVHLLSCTAGNS